MQEERTRVDPAVPSGRLIVRGQKDRRHARPPRVFSGLCDLIDKRPFDVILTQLIRVARPVATWDGVDKVAHGFLGAIERFCGDRQDAAGLFAVGLGEICLAIDAGHRRDRAVGPRRQQHGPPPDEGGGDRHSRYGVTEVVLAVAKRSLAVFPRFAPMNGRQGDE